MLAKAETCKEARQATVSARGKRSGRGYGSAAAPERFRRDDRKVSRKQSGALEFTYVWIQWVLSLNVPVRRGKVVSLLAHLREEQLDHVEVEFVSTAKAMIATWTCEQRGRQSTGSKASYAAEFKAQDQDTEQRDARNLRGSTHLPRGTL